MDGENNLMLRPVNWPTLNSVEVFIHRMVKLTSLRSPNPSGST